MRVAYLSQEHCLLTQHDNSLQSSHGDHPGKTDSTLHRHPRNPSTPPSLYDQTQSLHTVYQPPSQQKMSGTIRTQTSSISILTTESLLAEKTNGRALAQAKMPSSSLESTTLLMLRLE